MVKVFSNSDIRLGTAMLLGSVENGVLCFSQIGRAATLTGVYLGVASDWDSIIVGSEGGHFVDWM